MGILCNVGMIQMIKSREWTKAVVNMKDVLRLNDKNDKEWTIRTKIGLKIKELGNLCNLATPPSPK